MRTTSDARRNVDVNPRQKKKKKKRKENVTDEKPMSTFTVKGTRHTLCSTLKWPIRILAKKSKILGE